MGLRRDYASRPSNSTSAIDSSMNTLFRLAPLAAVIAMSEWASGAEPKIFLIHDGVPQLAQAKRMGCWATAATILASWKEKRSLGEHALLQRAGGNWGSLYDSDAGLAGRQVAEFAKAVKLRAHAPQSYSPDGWKQLLGTGPVWVGTAILDTSVPYKHVRVVYGVEGDGTGAGTRLLLIDPDGGRRYSRTLVQFAQEIESVARQELGATGNINPQVISY